MTILDMRTVSVALLLLANALGITAAPLLSTGQNVTAASFSITSQNATEQDLIKRLNNIPLMIYAKRILPQDKGKNKKKHMRYNTEALEEYCYITLGHDQGLEFVPEVEAASTVHIERRTINPGSWWSVIPRSVKVRKGRPDTIFLGTITFKDFTMRRVLLGENALSQLEESPIHSPLVSQGKSSAKPTPKMYLDAADAMVQRLRNLDSFYEGLLLEEEYRNLDANLRRKAEKKDEARDGRSIEGNRGKRRRTRRDEGEEEEEGGRAVPGAVFEEERDEHGNTAWGAYFGKMTALWASLEDEAAVQASSSKP
ncbi:hypothetical protein EV360DRAFT_67713 [Lentinula raphanica]|nr:hypothetical protein EV360DRAFT_67713 [Lentinula raphanica]